MSHIENTKVDNIECDDQQTAQTCTKQGPFVQSPTLADIPSLMSQFPPFDLHKIQVQADEARMICGCTIYVLISNMNLPFLLFIPGTSRRHQLQQI